ncbi:DLW-39 family protein [Dermatophilaceae bacterium Sec6.4]
MLKKIVVLAGVAAVVAFVKKKRDQDQAGKDLWAQAADKPTA